MGRVRESEGGLGHPLIEEQGHDHTTRRWGAAALHGGDEVTSLGHNFGLLTVRSGPRALKQNCSFPDAL